MQTEIIALKISPEDKAKVIAKAREYSLPFASYCRMIILQEVKKEGKGDSA